MSVQVPVKVLRRCPLPGGVLLLRGERALVPYEYLSVLTAPPQPYVFLDTDGYDVQPGGVSKALFHPPHDTMVRQADVSKGVT